MTEGPRRLRVISGAQPAAPSRRALLPADDRYRLSHRRSTARDIIRLILLGCTAFVVVLIYVGLPVALLAGDRLDSVLHATLLAAAVVALGASTILCILHSTNLDVDKSGSYRKPAALRSHPVARRAM
jgi:hypothetical protein